MLPLKKFTIIFGTYFATKSKYDKNIFESKFKKSETKAQPVAKPIKKIEIPKSSCPIPPEPPEEVVIPKQPYSISPEAPETIPREEETSWWRSIFG